jgi:hypothetical protein
MGKNGTDTYADMKVEMTDSAEDHRYNMHMAV